MRVFVRVCVEKGVCVFACVCVCACVLFPAIVKASMNKNKKCRNHNSLYLSTFLNMMLYTYYNLVSIAMLIAFFKDILYLLIESTGIRTFYFDQFEVTLENATKNTFLLHLQIPKCPNVYFCN